MVSVGQIWEYRRGSDIGWVVPDKFIGKQDSINYAEMAWEVVSGAFNGSELEWRLKVVRDRDQWLNVSEFTFSEKVFEGERFRLIYDPAQDIGAYCSKCKRFCEYAIWKPLFECWGCRNGF